MASCSWDDHRENPPSLAVWQRHEIRAVHHRVPVRPVHIHPRIWEPAGCLNLKQQTTDLASYRETLVYDPQDVLKQWSREPLPHRYRSASHAF